MGGCVCDREGEINKRKFSSDRRCKEQEVQGFCWLHVEMWVMHAHTNMQADAPIILLPQLLRQAQNIRQKLAIWDDKHKLHAPQNRQKMGY